MKSKKLRKSYKNKIIAGVCSGIGEYFGINPWIPRILFILVSGGAIVYLILAYKLPFDEPKL